MMTIKGYLTVADVAAELKVHANTVRKWCERGFIRYAWHTVGTRRQRVFTPSQIEAFKRKASKPFSPIRSQRSAELVDALHTALNDAKPRRAARKFLDAIGKHLERQDKSR